MRRLLYRLYRRTSGGRYWIRRRFTRAGLAVAGGGIVAAALAADPEQTLAYQAFSLLLGLLVVAVVCSRGFRPTLEVTRRLPRFGTVGVPLSYRVVVRNLGDRPQTGLRWLEELEDGRPTLEEFVLLQVAEERRARSFRVASRRSSWQFERARVAEVNLPVLEPNSPHEVPAELLPLRRGRLSFTGGLVARPDPLGLFQAWARLAAPQAVLILPRRYPLPPLALPGSRQYQRGGVALASSVGESEEFVSLREYRRGDPRRRIHWRSWAKTGRPIVKEFEDEFFVRHALVLDTFTDHPKSEVFEAAVAVAASFACTVPTQESLLDLLFVGREAYCFTAGRGVGHTDQLLEVLASVQPCPDHAFGDLEGLVLEHAAAVSGCVVVLLEWDAARRQLVRRLGQLGLPVLVLVITEPGGGKSLDTGSLRDRPERFHVLETGRLEEGLARL
ncbi:MAG: DUF58 domain-containing protein [Verrucomicrobia bacterium]|nr:DUF58 domain-containing protein [Verrucomicrobiota bacterium]